MRRGLLAFPAACLLAAPALAQPVAELPPSAYSTPIQSPSLTVLRPLEAAQAPALVPPAPPAPLLQPIPSAHDFTDALPAAAAPDAPCGPRVWASVDYLRWWIEPENTPSLIQTVPSGVASANGSTLPAGSATQYFPYQRQVHFGAFNGYRGTLGYAGDGIGVDVTGFSLGQNSQSGSLFNNGIPYAIAQSYVSAGSGAPISLYSSLAGQYVGGTDSQLTSRLWGADANVRVPWFRILADWNNVLFGVRYFELQESLNVGSHSIFPNGSTLYNQDSIRTRNQFYGGQVGLATRVGAVERGLGLDSTIKLGLGDMHESADLQGSNGFTLPNGTVANYPGGLYVQPTNAGTHSRDKVAFLTEYDLNLTYNFTRSTQIYFGYSLIYLSNVMRPGQAIDPVVNDSLVRYVANPTQSLALRPAFSWNAHDFWTQGLNLGFKYSY